MEGENSSRTLPSDFLQIKREEEGEEIDHENMATQLLGPNLSAQAKS